MPKTGYQKKLVEVNWKQNKLEDEKEKKERLRFQFTLPMEKKCEIDRSAPTQAEIEELTLSEINEWFAYFKVVEDGKSKS